MVFRTEERIPILGRRPHLAAHVVIEDGLVYIPAIDAPSVWADWHNGGRVKFINSFFTVLGIIPDDTYDAKRSSPISDRFPT